MMESDHPEAVTTVTRCERRKARPASPLQMQMMYGGNHHMATTDDNKLRSIAGILGVSSVALLGVTACDNGGGGAEEPPADDGAGVEEEGGMEEGGAEGGMEEGGAEGSEG